MGVTRKRRLTRFQIAAALSVAMLTVLCLLTQSNLATSAGFTARIVNSNNTAGTAQTASYFTCEAAVTADSSTAVFAYKLNDTAGTTNTAPATTYEAESASLSGGALVMTDHSNYSGTGFVGGFTDANKGAAKTTFTVTANATATYTLSLRYANANGTAQSLTRQVDTGTATSFSLPVTASWDRWTMAAPLTATWSAGTTHTVTYSYGASDTGNVNIDYLYVTAGDTSTDSFTGTSGTTLQSHTGEAGATWAKRAMTGVTADAVITTHGIRKGTAASYAALYTTTATPPTPNYTVSADIVNLSTITNDIAAVVGRYDASDAAGTFYTARYVQSTGSYTLGKYVGGTFTALGTGYVATMPAGGAVRLSLDMNGSSIRLLVNGVPRVTATDTAITGAGTAGISFGFAYNGANISTTVTEDTGMQLSNFASTQDGSTTTTTPTTAADFSGHNAPGAYAGTVAGSTATPIACPRDSGSAYVLDGSSSYISAPTLVSSPATFTLETWFKTTVASGKLIGFDSSRTGGSGQYDRQIYLSSGGKLNFGVYSSGYHVITSPNSYTDGTWHHVVSTLSPTTGMKLYVDGAQVAANATYTTAEPHQGYWRNGGAPGANLGGWDSGTVFFAGSLRFLAVYSSEFSAAQVSAHYNAGKQ